MLSTTKNTFSNRLSKFNVRKSVHLWYAEKHVATHEIIKPF